MREISLDRLRTLVAIADLGSFAEAARVLNLAPPTVSLHIADLESRVGGKLLSRTRGRVQPSAIGETLVERARRLLADAEQALEDVQRQVQGAQMGERVHYAEKIRQHPLEALFIFLVLQQHVHVKSEARYIHEKFVVYVAHIHGPRPVRQYDV